MKSITRLITSIGREGGTHPIIRAYSRLTSVAGGSYVPQKPSQSHQQYRQPRSLFLGEIEGPYPYTQTRPRYSLIDSDTRRHFLRECRPRTGNDGLLRSANAYGNVQDVRYLRGCCHLFRRFDLRRNTDDERSFPGRYSRSIRGAVRCRRTRMGRWLDRLANRPVDVTVRHDQAGRTVTNQSGHE